LYHLPGYGIIIQYVIGTVIFPVMVLHGLVGVRYCNIIIGGITGYTCGMEEEFQVHHIINDNGTLPFFRPVPGLDNSCFWAKSCRKGPGRLYYNGIIGGSVHVFQGVAIGAFHNKTYIMVPFPVL